jgi:hypothetical protein
MNKSSSEKNPIRYPPEAPKLATAAPKVYMIMISNNRDLAF